MRPGRAWRATRDPTASSSRASIISVLAFRQAHDQAVQVVADADLAGQAAVRLHVLGEVQHGLLHGRGAAGFGGGILVDIDVAGRAGAGAAAVGVDARHIVADRAFHDGKAGLDLDRVFGPVVLDVGDLGHAGVLARPAQVASPGARRARKTPGAWRRRGLFRRIGRPDQAAVFLRDGETISFLVSAIALAGFNPLGQTWAQFMMVWQRYSLNGSSRSSRRFWVASSRLSAI